MTSTNATRVSPVVPDFERGVFLIPSWSEPGRFHEATVATGESGVVRVTCGCPAGRHARHGVPVACRHGRAVCGLLAAHGLAEPVGDHWVSTEQPPTAA